MLFLTEIDPIISKNSTRLNKHRISTLSKSVCLSIETRVFTPILARPTLFIQTELMFSVIVCVVNR